MNARGGPGDWGNGTMRRPEQRVLDELLVMRCQDGNAEALDLLVRRWQRPLLRHAYRLTGNADAAADAAQEAWMGIIRGIGRLDDAARFRAWAFRIATRKAIDWIRRRQRRRGRVEPLGARDVAAAPAADTDGAADMLARLPADQRALLSLKYLEEFTNAEIAEALGIPEGTVKSRLHHARNELRRLLEGDRS